MTPPSNSQASDVLERHITSVESVYPPGDWAYGGYTALCSCGWTGPTFGRADLAWTAAYDHKTLALGER